MEIDLMNIFHLTIDGKITVIRCNCTKKQLTEALKEYADEDPMFKPVKFKMLMHKKDYKFFYEQ